MIGQKPTNKQVCFFLPSGRRRKPTLVDGYKDGQGKAGGDGRHPPLVVVSTDQVVDHFFGEIIRRK